MANPRKLEYTAVIGLVLQAVFVLVCWILSVQSGGAAAQAELWHLALGTVVWLVVLIHGRQRRLAREERQETEELRARRLSEEIFEETELDTMRASTGLLIFEKYVVPVITIALSGGLLYFAYSIISTVWGAELPPMLEPRTLLLGTVCIAFVGFLVGKYAAGLAQVSGFRLLRAAGGYMLGNVIACVLIAAAATLYHFEVFWPEVVVTYLIPAIMGLVGVELLLNLVLDVYRPRVPGQERRPPYDSRLLSLFAEPEDVLKTVATTLDYQFGFKVSETWFYRFMERAIVPLVLVQVLALWVLSAVVVVDPYEVAFVETLGVPHVSAQDAEQGLLATPLQPGYYLKWPWPISVARFVPAYEIRSVTVGKVYEPTAGRWSHLYEGNIDVTPEPDVILWRERHISPTRGYEVNFLVPSTAQLPEKGAIPAGTPMQMAAAQMDVATAERTMRAETPMQTAEAVTGLATAREAPEVNLARLEATVHYRAKLRDDGTVDPRAAFIHSYQQQDLDDHVKKLAYRVLYRIGATQDFIRWIAEERGETVAKFRDMLQEAVDRNEMGVEVVFCGINAVHPPPEVAGAYEDVVTALEQKEAAVLEGEIEEVRTVADAKAFRAEMISFASGYAAKLLAQAQAEKEQFLVQLTAYAKAPLVYMFRSYFDTLEEALKGQQIFVVPETASEVDIIDMQQRIRPQLLNLDVTEE
ncbi:MAG: SPFH domain-containing protein [Candidatus Brocadiia bacterium]